MEAPYDFQTQEIADYFAIQPSGVKGAANLSVVTNKRYLYTKLFSVFDIVIPEEWPLNFFRYVLFRFGCLTGIYTNEMGWMCGIFGVSQLDAYWQPKVLTYTNHLLPEVKTGIVGVNCEIFKIMDDYGGLDDLITKYATKLSQIEKDIDINLMNANVAFVYGAENKKDADAFKEAYDEATEGKPLVTVNKALLEEGTRGTLFPNVSNTFIADKLQNLRRQILNELLTEIGIRNANYDKKERLNSMEVSENNDETQAIASIILKNLQESFDKFNKISGFNCSVSLNYNYELIPEGGASDE